MIALSCIKYSRRAGCHYFIPKALTKARQEGCSVRGGGYFIVGRVLFRFCLVFVCGVHSDVLAVFVVFVVIFSLFLVGWDVNYNYGLVSNSAVFVLLQEQLEAEGAIALLITPACFVLIYIYTALFLWTIWFKYNCILDISILHCYVGFARSIAGVISRCRGSHSAATLPNLVLLCLEYN